MKKIFITGFLFLFGNMVITAQDASLYQGPSDIYLRSGSVFKHTTLWEMDTVRVEYVYEGSLRDILNEEILRIVTRDYEIAFDERNHPVRKTYDLIIKEAGDTLRGFIVEIVNDRFVAYTPTTGKGVKETACKGFILSETTMKGKPIKTPKVTENAIKTQPDTGDIVEKQSQTENNAPVKYRTKAYPSAKKHSEAKDLILAKNGDSIFCSIIRDDKMKLIYDVPRVGNNKKVVITKYEVRHYYYGMYDRRLEVYDSAISSILKSQYPDLKAKNRDLIITLAGDHIWCVITKETDYDIYYSITLPGQNRKVRISRSLVKENSYNAR